MMDFPTEMERNKNDDEKWRTNMRFRESKMQREQTQQTDEFIGHNNYKFYNNRAQEILVWNFGQVAS